MECSQRRFGVSFTNVLQAAFACADQKSAKDTTDLTAFLLSCDLLA